MTSTQIPTSFREILLPHLPYAEGSEFTDDADLAALGLDSMGVVGLLAALEDRYELELPDELLTEETFASAGSLWATVVGLVPPDLVGPDAEAPSGPPSSGPDETDQPQDMGYE